MSPDTAMILAAGFGTRMGALTEERPKPLLQAAGRALIDHALDTAEAAGAGRAIVNLHYRGDQIRTHLADRDAPRITFSDEQPQILDTGGGLVQALPMLGEKPFYALNSDAVFVGPNPLAILRDAWRSGLACLMLLVPRGAARAYSRPGDFFLDADGGQPRRRGDAATAPLVYSGAQIVTPGAMRDAPPGAFSMNLVWDRLLAEGRLAAVTYPGAWIDVGTPEGLATADAALKARA